MHYKTLLASLVCFTASDCLAANWFGRSTPKEEKKPSIPVTPIADLPIPSVSFKIHILPSFAGERLIYGQILDQYLKKKLSGTRLNSQRTFTYEEGRLKIKATPCESYLGMITPETKFTLLPEYPGYLNILLDQPPSYNIADLDGSKYPPQGISSSSTSASSSYETHPEPFPIHITRPIRIDAPQIQPFTIDFLQLGIGGMDKQMKELVRRLTSRATDPKALKKIGAKGHTKGILLYGPPGTGKTLIGEKIGNMLQAEFKVVNGPEILSKYVGESEAKMRELFEPARRNPGKLYVIFFDEFDALARSRSGEGGAGSQVGANLVNQLLAMMDGAEKIDNIICIAATNRLDIIDAALLRPGRFGVQLCIGLPDEQGRHDIFNIHLRDIEEGGIGVIDVDDLARRTQNYTGAEIKAVCDEARSFSLQDAHSDHSKIGSVDIEKLKIEMKHFEAALETIRPAFGQQANFNTHLPDRDLLLKSQRDTLQMALHRLKSCRPGSVSSLLITGEKGTGKSALAGLIADATKSEFDLIRIISANVLQKPVSSQIEEAWQAAQVVKNTLIIMEDLERLISMVNEHRFNEGVVTKLNTLLSEKTKKKIVVLATMGSKSSTIFKLINPTATWTATYLMPDLTVADISAILTAQNIAVPGLEDKLIGKSTSQVLDILYSGNGLSSLEEWDSHISMFDVDTLLE